MVVVTERWKHTVDMQEVHSFEEGFYSPSLTCIIGFLSIVY